MIPYPRPCLATLSPSLNRDPGGEPLRGLTGGQARPVHPSLSLAPRHQPPSFGTWAHATAPSPRRFPCWRAEWAACPRGRALARARWAKNPPQPS
jgi:hypothetical protein